jgi:hypothetical protein
MPLKIKAPLKPSDFVTVCWSGVEITETPGTEIIESLGFDPKTCHIEVGADGHLSVNQPGRSFIASYAPRFWRKVTV